MFVCVAATHVLVHAPAKLNLFLEVLGRRPDGFHEIETLMGAVSIFDTLEFAPRTEGELRLSCRWAGGIGARNKRREPSGDVASATTRDAVGDLPQGEQNLVYRAVARLRDRCAVTGGADIRLHKRIPSAAGLGGASSDAAAALVAANAAWKLGCSPAQLAELAAELGSDIPFFLAGGFAICRGRGEQIESIRGSRFHAVVARPPVGLSTADVYRRWRPGTPRGDVRRLQTSLAAGDWRTAKQRLVNGLQESATGLTPWVGRLTAALARLGCQAGQMSGSGSSCFGICRSARHARRLAAQLRSLNLGEVFQTTSSANGKRPQRE
ncbi:MAG TPA: 4-(cytidine 5'-diphospho)-2-C-methyl-D-erythritol kinase [Pirellulaceae bacterium]|nr:4-(cytidine 5'-diphospho)-2-C-methyl-D-erythritol kinase [Pirellulaceae bacterium]